MSNTISNAPVSSASLRPTTGQRVAEGFRTVLNVGAGVLKSVTPFGGLIGGAAQGASNPDIDGMWAMQRESQAFNLQYLALQNAIQADNRDFTTQSNLSKAQHETAKAAVQNIRV